MADTKELLIELKLQNDQLNDQLIKAVSQTQAKMKGLEGQTEKTRFGVRKLKAGYLLLAGVITGVVGAAFGKAIKKASDFEEANAKFGVVFKGVSKEANAMRKELVSSYGVSSLAATEMLAGIQDFLVPMGITREKATELSGSFAKLAVDIGSFNNAPTEQVMNDIKSAMAGMAVPLRKYGIDVSETTLKAMAQAEGIELVNGKLDRQSRAFLLRKKIMEDTRDAENDFIRTQDSFANTMKRIQAIGEDVTIIFGQEFMSAIAPATREIAEFISSQEGMEAVAKAARGLVTAFHVLWSIIKTITNSLELAVQSTIGFTKSIHAFVTNMKNGLTAARESFSQEWDKMKEKNAVDTQDITDTWTHTSERLKEIWGEAYTFQVDGMNAVVAADAETQAIIQANAEETAKKKKELAEAEARLRREQVSATETALSNISTLTQSKNKELFNIGKAAGISNAIINVAQAITRTMASIPFPFNIPLAAGQAAAGAVQVNTIKNQKMQGFAEGGQPPIGRPSIVGEAGPELFVPNQSGTIIPNNQINNANTDVGGINIVVNTNNGQDVVDTMNDYFKEVGGARDLGVG
jgi:hypothetical protein